MISDRRETRTDLIVVGAIWVVVTGVALWWIASTNFHPLGASTNAEITDDAFNLLMYLAAPVTTFVLVVLGYSVVRFRTAADDEDESAPVRSNRLFVALWIVITAGLSVYVIINPGFTGLDALAADTEEDLTIEVIARQWGWDYTYVEDDLTIDSGGELVLPVDTRILFKVTSLDVIHSFWIPAFRIKKDAVPGITTEVYMTATDLGDFAEDDGFRVQCAELCGAGHANMNTRVSVRTRADFDMWVQETKIAEQGE
jgi:cytochrome c oxidase subunit 2